MGILTSVFEFKSISTLPALRGRRLGLLLFHFTEQKCIVISDFQLIQLPKLFLSNCNLSNKSASIHVLRLLCACSSENNLPAAVVLGLLLFQNSAQAGSMSVHQVTPSCTNTVILYGTMPHTPSRFVSQHFVCLCHFALIYAHCSLPYPTVLSLQDNSAHF